ncbi:MAG: AsmA family protein [Candidatus Nucleicultricaceae bacterium]
MKRIIYGVSGMVVFLIAGVLLLPLFINLNHYKPEIQQAAMNALGREVAIEGDIKLSILPIPNVHVSNIRVANIKGAIEPNLVLVDRVEASFAFLPLLQRRLEFTKLSFIHPRLFLEETASGEKNWAFEKTPSSTSDDAQKGMESIQETPGVLPTKIDIKKIKVINAELTYKKMDSLYHFENLDLDVLRSDDRVFKGSGNFDIAASKVKADFNLDLGEEAPTFDVGVRLEGSDLNFKGSFNPKEHTFKTTIRLNLKPYNLPVLKESLKALPVSLDEHIVIQTNLEGSLDALKIKDMRYDSDTLSFKGKGAIDPGRQMATLSLSELPGDTSFNLRLNLDHRTSGDMDLYTSEPLKLLKALTHDAVLAEGNDVLNKLKRVTFKTGFSYQNQALDLNSLFISVKNSIIKGGCSIDFSVPSSKVFKVDLTLKALDDLLQMLGYDQPIKGFSDGSIKGSIHMGEKGAQLNLEAHALDGKMTASGQLQPLKLAVSLSHPKASELLRMLSGKQQDIPLGLIKINSDIAYEDPILTLSNIKGQVSTGSENASLSGDLKVHLLNASTGIEGKMNISKIDFTSLGLVQPVEAITKEDIVKGTTEHRRKKSVHKTEAVKGATPWSKDPILPMGGKDISADLMVSVGLIKIRDIAVNDVSFKVNMGEGTLGMPFFKGSVFGGDLNGNASLDEKNTLLKFTLKDAKLERVAVKNAAFKILQGKTTIKGDFTSSGKSSEDLVSNLNGMFDVSVRDGVFQGFNLQSLVDLLKNLNGPQMLPNLMNVMQGGETRFNQFSIVLGFTKGIGKISTFDLTVPDVDVKTSGTIDLPRFVLDTNWVLSIPKNPDLPPVKMRVFGPLDDPQKNIDMAGLQQYLVTNIFSRLTKRGNVIENLLGLGGGSDSNTSKTPDSNAKEKDSGNPLEKALDKPEEAVKDILKGLF